MILPMGDHLEMVGKLMNFGDPESYASGRSWLSTKATQASDRKLNYRNTGKQALLETSW